MLLQEAPLSPRNQSLYQLGFRHKRHGEGEPPANMTEWEKEQWENGVKAAETYEKM